MEIDKTIVYLDDLTTMEHLQPILRELGTLGECKFWVLSSVDRDDERFSWFRAEAPGAISIVWPWEMKLNGLLNRLLRILHRWAPHLQVISVRLFGKVWRRAGDLEQATRFICGWGSPFTFMFQAARRLGVPGIQIPHGFSIFDEQKSSDEMVAEDRPLISFSDRNVFDLIIVQSTNLASALHHFGISHERMRVLGSPRFSSEWSSALNARIQKEGKRERPDVDVLFLLPNWNYRVRWKDLKAVVELLATAPLTVTIGMHQRVPKTGTKASEYLRELKQFEGDGLEILTEPAYRLIPSSKLTLASGTSVGLHALSAGQPFLNLAFLNANRTIYDLLDGINVGSLEQLAVILDSVTIGNFPTLPDPAKLTDFLNEYIRQGKSFEQLVDSYISAISSVEKK